MPAQFTHRILAERVLAALPAEVGDKIASLPAYYLGAQGPDVFYFLRVRKGKEKNLGAYLHNEGGYRVFCSLLAQAKKENIALSYAAGYITHYAADIVFHPFVYGMIGRFTAEEPAWEGRRHAYIECDLDTHFVEEIAGGEVCKYSFPREEKEVDLAAMYKIFSDVCLENGREPISKRSFRTAVGRFFLFGRIFTDEHLRRRKFWGKAEEFLHIPHFFSSLYRRAEPDARCLNRSRDQWHNPSRPSFVSCESADELFFRAERECVRLICLFFEALNGAPLPREDFGKSFLTGLQTGIPLVRPTAGVKEKK